MGGDYPTQPLCCRGGVAELFACLPGCSSYLFLSVDLVGNGGEGSFAGGRRRKM